MSTRVAVIGGGAAGHFAAISAKTHHPGAQVTLFEKSRKTLSKVKVSGGGRCNVTHACFSIAELVKHYPRGSRFLKKSFHQFSTRDTVNWFQERGVELKTEADNRMFPVSNDSQTIIDCLRAECANRKVNILMGTGIKTLIPNEEKISLLSDNDESLVFDKVIVASGGSPKRSGLEWLAKLGHKIEEPVPSLFTFNMPQESIKQLMGLVAPNARVKIQGSKLQAEGPVLITHWGMSGPGILKLSAFGARELADIQYQFKVQINWVASESEEEFRSLFTRNLESHGRAKLGNLKVGGIPSRLWLFLLNKLDLSPDRITSELGKKDRNRLINQILNDTYSVSGKTTFKEEFVTCGGVSLSDIDPNSMQSRVVPNLYFAGEVMDVDGVTGGFNFQAAWTSGFIAGKLL